MPDTVNRRLVIVGRVLWWAGLAFMAAVLVLLWMFLSGRFWTPFLLGDVVVHISTAAAAFGTIGIVLWCAALVCRLVREPNAPPRRRDWLRTVVVVVVAVPMTLLAAFIVWAWPLVNNSLVVFDQSSAQGCQLVMRREVSVVYFYTVPDGTRTLTDPAHSFSDYPYRNNPIDGGSWSLEWDGETAVLAAFDNLYEIPCGQ